MMRDAAMVFATMRVSNHDVCHMYVSQPSSDCDVGMWLPQPFRPVNKAQKL